MLMFYTLFWLSHSSLSDCVAKQASVFDEYELTKGTEYCFYFNGSLLYFQNSKSLSVELYSPNNGEYQLTLEKTMEPYGILYPGSSIQNIVALVTSSVDQTIKIAAPGISIDALMLMTGKVFATTKPSFDYTFDSSKFGTMGFGFLRLSDGLSTLVVNNVVTGAAQLVPLQVSYTNSNGDNIVLQEGENKYEGDASLQMILVTGSGFQGSISVEATSDSTEWPNSIDGELSLSQFQATFLFKENFVPYEQIGESTTDQTELDSEENRTPINSSEDSEDNQTQSENGDTSKATEKTGDSNNIIIIVSVASVVVVIVIVVVCICVCRYIKKRRQDVGASTDQINQIIL